MALIRKLLHLGQQAWSDPTQPPTKATEARPEPSSPCDGQDEPRPTVAGAHSKQQVANDARDAARQALLGQLSDLRSAKEALEALAESLGGGGKPKQTARLAARISKVLEGLPVLRGHLTSLPNPVDGSDLALVRELEGALATVEGKALGAVEVWIKANCKGSFGDLSKTATALALLAHAKELWPRRQAAIEAAGELVKKGAPAGAARLYQALLDLETQVTGARSVNLEVRQLHAAMLGHATAGDFGRFRTTFLKLGARLRAHAEARSVFAELQKRGPALPEDCAPGRPGVNADQEATELYQRLHALTPPLQPRDLITRGEALLSGARGKALRAYSSAKWDSAMLEARLKLARTNVARLKDAISELEQEVRSAKPGAHAALAEKRAELNTKEGQQRELETKQAQSASALNAARGAAVIQLAQLRDELLSRSGLSAEAARDLAAWVDFSGAKLSKHETELARTEIATFLQLTGGRGALHLLSIVSEGHRPFAAVHGQKLNHGHGLDVDLLWHELGHFFESSDQRLRNVAANWRNNRAHHGRNLVVLNSERSTSGKETLELALPGRFFSEYVGKLYKARAHEDAKIRGPVAAQMDDATPEWLKKWDGQTEVYSTAFEHFSSPERMLRFYELDARADQPGAGRSVELPAHFLLVLGALALLGDGGLGGRQAR